MVKLTPEQQAQFISAHPGVFEPAAGAWGRGGSTMVILAATDQETIGEAMTQAWNLTTQVASVGRGSVASGASNEQSEGRA